MRPTMLAVLCALILVPGIQARDQDVLESIVTVQARIRPDAGSARTLGLQREGAGIVIDRRGLILTIGYLVMEAESIRAVSYTGEVLDADFVAYDFETGFGLVRARGGDDLPPLELGDSDSVALGDNVTIATVSSAGVDGIQEARVISVGEFVGYWEYLLEKAIYASPPHPSFGGAALIGPDGRLVGVGSIFTRLSFPEVGVIPTNMFVPIDLLKPILEQLKSTGRALGPRRPWLGINTQETRGRVLVQRVTPGGPADKAGIRPGDILLAVAGREFADMGDFFRKVWALGNAGVQVPLTVLQGSQINQVIIPSGDRYDHLKLGTGDAAMLIPDGVKNSLLPGRGT